jgi:hypothetical protein
MSLNHRVFKPVRGRRGDLYELVQEVFRMSLDLTKGDDEWLLRSLRPTLLKRHTDSYHSCQPDD